jgi:outer membrane protein OmpA-like peptidoglycan-associated protein
MPRNPLVACLASGLAACLAVTALPAPADAQLLRKAKKTVGNAAEAETLNQLDRMVRGKVRCVFDDAECIRQAEASGKEVVLTDDSGKILVDEQGGPVSDPAKGAEIAGRAETPGEPGQGAWTNYDFQPGDDILLYDDFTGDEVGDFPRRFELVQGSFEVVEWNGGRYLRATSNGLFAIPLPKTLPERFTVEFAVNLRHGNANLRLMPGRAFYGPPPRSYTGSVASVEPSQAGIRPVGKAGGPQAMGTLESGRLREDVVPVRLMADGEHVKMYVGEQRVANVPNAVFPRADTLFVSVSAAAEKHPILVGPIRIAGGGRDLYDRLARDGRVATQGILFATNSDRIRPESTPTLDEIATMLEKHPELRISIEGHTDSDGEEGYNLTLSEQRAAAVKAFLVSARGIRPDRLQTAGFGETKPAADNATPEGRQQNRRVELVRL